MRNKQDWNRYREHILNDLEIPVDIAIRLCEEIFKMEKEEVQVNLEKLKILDKIVKESLEVSPKLLEEEIN